MPKDEELQIGDKVIWRHCPRGGYGYSFLIAGEVIGFGRGRIKIRVNKADGGIAERFVHEKNVTRKTAKKYLGDKIKIPMPEFLDHIQPILVGYLAGVVMRDGHKFMKITDVKNKEPTGFDIVFESGFIIRIDVSVKQKQGGDQC